MKKLFITFFGRAGNLLHAADSAHIHHGAHAHLGGQGMTRPTWFAVLLALFTLSAFAQVAPTPFEYYSVDEAGQPLTNRITIEPWPNTNQIVGVSNLIVGGRTRTYTPDANGFINGYLMPNAYKLNIADIDYGVVFGMVSSAATQNLARLAGFPVPVFMNFTLAQFADAGTLARSNASAFVPLVTNVVNGQIELNAPGFARLPGTNLWTGANRFQSPAVITNSGSVLAGDGSGLRNLDASAMLTGTLADDRLSTNVLLAATDQGISGSKMFTGSNFFSGTLVVSNEAARLHVGTLFATNGTFTNVIVVNPRLIGGSVTGLVGNFSGGVYHAPALVSPVVTNSFELYAAGEAILGLHETNSGYHWKVGGKASQFVIERGAETLFTLGTNETATLGTAATAAHANSIAIGMGAATTTPNQIMLGGPGISARVQNDLTVGGAVQSVVHAGTNRFPVGADISFGRYAITSLATSNNAAVLVGANVFVEVSGPAGPFSVNGLDGYPNRDGKLVIVVNQTGYDMTIAHQSGVDPAPANRIITMSGGDRTTSGNGAATLIYSGAASRWILISFDP